ncbi:MAG: hypothetical protein AAB646_01215 [Patescibacteria group bacterium]
MNNINDRDFQNRHRTEWKDFLWDRFLEKFSGIKSKKQQRKAIDLLFSDYEKQLITKRLAALILLREGRGSKEISAIKKAFLGPGPYKSQRSFKSMKKESDFTIAPKNLSWLDSLFNDIDLWEIIKNPPRPRGTGIKDSYL